MRMNVAVIIGLHNCIGHVSVQYQRDTVGVTPLWPSHCARHKDVHVGPWLDTWQRHTHDPDD